MRSRNKSVWRFRSDPTFKLTIEGEGQGSRKQTGRGDFQLIADYVYCLLHLGTVWECSKLSRKEIVTQANPEEALAYALYHERLPGTDGAVDGVVAQWLKMAESVKDAVEAFVESADSKLKGVLQARVFGTDPHSMEKRLQNEWGIAVKGVLEQFPAGVDVGRRDKRDLLMWNSDRWREHLSTEDGYLNSNIGRDAFFHLVATSLAVAKHGLLQLDEAMWTPLFGFLGRAKVILDDVLAPGADQRRRVWVTESSLCTELALRTLVTAAEVPFVAADGTPSDHLQLRGSMVLVRVFKQQAGELLVRSIGQVLGGLHPTNPVRHAFAVISDFGQWSLQGSFDEPTEYFGAWYQRLQGHLCASGKTVASFEVMPEAGSHMPVLPGEGGGGSVVVKRKYLWCRSCESIHHPVKEYSDLDGLPALLIVVGKGRMGDTVSRLCVHLLLVFTVFGGRSCGLRDSIPSITFAVVLWSLSLHSFLAPSPLWTSGTSWVDFLVRN